MTYFSVAGPQRPPQEQRDVQDWGGQEETTTGGGGGQGQCRDGLRGLRGAVADSISVQISGEDLDGGGRQLAGGGGKPGKGQEELGETAGDT